MKAQYDYSIKNHLYSCLNWFLFQRHIHNNVLSSLLHCLYGAFYVESTFLGPR
ncbi:hypothetical protein BD408DRAFT_426513 [Parasitella parasitica]|nr:hypothetical protein BD408DRAFT_426513 [Parasitella parasitica]